MRDKTHTDFIERWANFVKNHPREKWKPQLKGFIDSQIIMANRFYSNLLKTKGGAEKLRLLRK